MAAGAEREQGFALVFVLWVMAVLAILVTSFIHETGTQAKITRNQYDRARARALADAGISLAVLGLLDRAEDRSWRLDGSVRELTFDGGTIRLRLQDEAGKIDLNEASAALLTDLFRMVAREDGEESVRLADNLASWKTDRLTRWKRLNGAATQTSVGPFLAVEELLEVPGITREIYAHVAPFLTVWSRSARVDPLSAPLEVLLSLPGAGARQIEAYVAVRNKYGPDPSILPMLAGLDGYLTRAGTGVNISIESEASANPAGHFTRDAMVSLLAAGGQRYRFISWRESGRTLATDGDG